MSGISWKVASVLGLASPSPTRSPEASRALTWTGNPARLSTRTVTWPTLSPTAARISDSTPTTVITAVTTTIPRTTGSEVAVGSSSRVVIAHSLPAVVVHRRRPLLRWAGRFRCPERGALELDRALPARLPPVAALDRAPFGTVVVAGCRAAACVVVVGGRPEAPSKAISSGVATNTEE
jgi:hypothetical protein